MQRQRKKSAWFSRLLYDIRRKEMDRAYSLMLGACWYYTDFPTVSYYTSAPMYRAEALSDALSDVGRLSVCLSRTSGLTREQRGLGRLKY